MRRSVQIVRRAFYGYREEAKDAYLTTEFVTIWVFPVFPVNSLRVVKSQEAGGEASKTRIPLIWAQALEGLSVTVGAVAALAFCVWMIVTMARHGWEA